MKNSNSIFSQQLDRAIFVTYFLGAIVPLMALGYVMHTYVFPAVENDSGMTSTMLGVITGIGVLNLAAFFALRRLTSNAVSRMDADNVRLQSILSASQELSASRHVNAVGETAVACANTLTSAAGVLLIMRAKPEKPLVMVVSSGHAAQALFERNQENILLLVENCIEGGKPSGMRAKGAAKREGSEDTNLLRAAIALPLCAESDASGALVVINSRATDGSFESAEQDALTTLAMLTSVALRNAELQDSQRNFFAHITDTLVSAMDSHIDNRRGHAMAVAQLSNRLARELELPDEKMQRLHFAAMLHDIGMLRIDVAHQRSPGHFQKHPVIGYRMLSRIRLWEDVAPIVLYHHEWYDGSGYPEAREGADIPYESRIIAVADCYDAMLRGEKHRSAKTPAEALVEIRSAAGTQFDPEIVAALEIIAERGEVPSR